MKVYMDRTQCTCWLAPCESSFGWRLLRLLNGEVLPGGCMYDFEEDGRKALTFMIHDHDGDKLLEVDKRNWPEAYDSWQLLWEKQHSQAN